jgi:hypothetical protein
MGIQVDVTSTGAEQKTRQMKVAPWITGDPSIDALLSNSDDVLTNRSRAQADRRLANERPDQQDQKAVGRGRGSRRIQMSRELTLDEAQSSLLGRLAEIDRAITRSRKGGPTSTTRLATCDQL